MENTVKIWTQIYGSNSRPKMRDLSGVGSWKSSARSHRTCVRLRVHKYSIDDGRPPLLSKNMPLLSEGFLICFRIPDRVLKPVQVNWLQNSRLGGGGSIGGMTKKQPQIKMEMLWF